LALAYSVVNPLFESPDEFLHYEFVRYLIDRRELPVQTPGKLSEFHQPPLYYVDGIGDRRIPTRTFAPIDNPSGDDAYRFGVDNKVRFIIRKRKFLTRAHFWQRTSLVESRLCWER
jgi:hypothetical protein